MTNKIKEYSLPNLMIKLFESGKPWSTREMYNELKQYFPNTPKSLLSNSIYQTRHMLRNGKRRVGLKMNIERVFCDDHVWRWKLMD